MCRAFKKGIQSTSFCATVVGGGGGGGGAAAAAAAAAALVVVVVVVATATTFTVFVRTTRTVYGVPISVRVLSNTSL